MILRTILHPQPEPLPDSVRPFLRLTALLTVFVSALSEASEYRETNDFADAASCVAEYVDKYGADNTLLVIDIDNTLLAMNDPLGSDQWFEWQEYLLEHESDSPYLVAPTFAKLLDAQGLLFTVGRMRPPQPDLPALVDGVQSLGVPTLVLTSRGDDFRVATERELENNGYDLAKSVIETKGFPGGRFPPYELDRIEEAGLTPEEARLYRLREPREVSFENGVFMGAGQHKGAMLIAVLHRALNQPSAVVFVDDHGRHVHRVYDALVRRGIEVTTFHYHREDEHVKRFRYSDKTEIDRRWRRIESALSNVFSPAADAMPAAR